MWAEPNVLLRCLTHCSCRPHEESVRVKTAGRWPWKLESAKECVTTHLPNAEASKMDDAQAMDRCSTKRLSTLE